MTPLRNVAAPTRVKPLRLWPGVVLAGLQLFSWFVVPRILPDSGMYGFLGTLACALGIVLWWTFFSRAPIAERFGILLLLIAATYVASLFIHISITGGGTGMGMLFYFLSPPLATFVLVVAAVIGSRLSDGGRRAVLVTSMLLVSGMWTLLRFDGIYGGGGFDFAWRWATTPEERMLAAAGNELVAPPAAAPAAEAPKEAPKEQPAAPDAGKAATPAPAQPPAIAKAEWPGFRGPNRDSIIPDLRIETNWVASPPVELWRKPIGPGWSSFAVGGDFFYTQEQRGDHEVVACYRMKTGEPVWRHGEAVRFWEPGSGAGPRGTPTLHSGRVYAFGATGILNALDAGNGAVVWSRDVAKEHNKKVPGWGFASSPLIVGDIVVVAASGLLAAYDRSTGEPRWTGPARTGSYSSPHLMTIDGVEQIVFLCGDGAVSVSPADGKLLWEHAWAAGGAAMLQPARAENGDILMATSGMAGGEGVRRLTVARESSGWKVTERWTTRGLKPYYNDFVVHKGHAYGFDGSILSCINLETGERKWKGGRYGNGQMVLLPDQDVLLVIAEEGELALVAAKPDQFTELAKVPALEGKTWNHPALVGDVLLVRNDREMVAFRLRKPAGGVASQPATQPQ